MPSEGTYEISVRKDGQHYPLASFPSVTRILKHWGDPQGFLMRWAVAEAKAGRDPFSYAAAERGSAAHKAIEEYFLSGKTPEDGGQYFEQYLDFTRVSRVRMVQSEYPTAHLTHGYAGTVDARVFIPGKGEGLMDVKTKAAGKGGRLYDNVKAQLVAYGMAELSLGREVSHLHVLQLEPARWHFKEIPEADWPRLHRAFLGAHEIGRNT